MSRIIPLRGKKKIYCIYCIYYICRLVILWNDCSLVLNHHLKWSICSTTLNSLWLWKLDVPNTPFCIQQGPKTLQVVKRKFFNDGATTFLYLWVEVNHLFWSTNCLYHIWAFISVSLFPIYFYELWLKWHISLHCVASPCYFLIDST